MAKTNITTPVGRIVGGSLYEPQTTDAEGKPLVVKHGVNAGQPRVNYFIALAIPKTGEPHWAHTAWGQVIWTIGNQAFPNFAQSRDFSWKIEDGDDATPNPKRKGRKNCETEGYAGHWIIKFSGGFAPKVYRQEGGGYVQIMEKDAVKPGYYVEIACSVEGNGSQSQPGVYLNHSMVCFRAYGQEISFGPDVASAGFGQAALPAGASMTPPASTVPMPAQPAPAPGAIYAPPGGQAYPPVAGGVPAPLPPGGSAPMQYAPAPGVPAQAPIPVTPNPQFVQVPPPNVPGAGVPAVPGVFSPPGAVGVPPVMSPSNLAPPPAPARQMTAAAQGTYEQYRAANWTDAQLVQNGLMLA